MPLSEAFFIPTFILINILSMMNRFKTLLLWGYFILGSFSFAQTSPDSLSTFYREDQFYFGVSFMGLINANSVDDPTGLSSHFHLGMVRDFPLTKNGKWALAAGVGYQTQRIVTGLTQENDNNNELLFFDRSIEDNATQAKLGLQSIELPLVLRWRTSAPTRYHFWRIYGGLKLCWNFMSKVVDIPKERLKENYFNRFHSDAFISFGFNTWNFYVSYPLQHAIKPIPIENRNYPYEFKTLKVGLIFYLL